MPHVYWNLSRTTTHNAIWQKWITIKHSKISPSVIDWRTARGRRRTGFSSEISSALAWRGRTHKSPCGQGRMHHTLPITTLLAHVVLIYKVQGSHTPHWFKHMLQAFPIFSWSYSSSAPFFFIISELNHALLCLLLLLNGAKMDWTNSSLFTQQGSARAKEKTSGCERMN